MEYTLGLMYEEGRGVPQNDDEGPVILGWASEEEQEWSHNDNPYPQQKTPKILLIFSL
jgi:hypothetical protein